ncbi:MAG TPA: twin-arginine translocase TatA/TatE family subunit, partial [Terracidiphilus sp.]
MAIPPPIELSSLGMADSLILMILALVVFGPRKLPQIGRQIGKLMYEFRKASNDFKFQMEEELRMSEEAERKQKEEAQRQNALTGQAAVSAATSSAALPAESSPSEPLIDPTVEKMPEIQPPRMSGPVIQPPSTGEIVAATKPDAAGPEA